MAGEHHAAHVSLCHHVSLCQSLIPSLKGTPVWPLLPRRLLQSYVVAAKRHGVPAHRVVRWVRRKLGADVLVIRPRGDGTLGCSAPCAMCQRELVRFDLRVHCSLSNGSRFSGRLTDRGAPKPFLSDMQHRTLSTK